MNKSWRLLMAISEANRRMKAHLTLRTLLDNAQKVLGYPHKQDRTIKIIKTSAFAGVKWVRFDGLAYGTQQYPLTMIFFNVDFSDKRDGKHVIPVRIESKREGVVTRYAERITIRRHPVRVFCGCMWFRFACEWYLAKAGALAPNRKARPYVRKTTTRPSPNPDKLPCVCKHLYQMALELQSRGVLINV